MSTHKKVFKDVKSFTVKRSKWKRGGKGPGETFLLNKEGHMCCLGFYALACGLPKKNIREVVAPRDLVRAGKNWNTVLVEKEKAPSGYEFVLNSDTAVDAIRANDDQELSDKDREADIKDTFKLVGIKVKFVD